MAQEDVVTSLLDHLRIYRKDVHDQILALVQDLTEEQMRWQPGDHAPSIGFHLWHLARWGDYDLQQFDGRRQIWETQNLATAWGFPAGLGEAATGTDLGDEESANLTLPDKGFLVDYTRGVFHAMDEYLECSTPEALLRPIAPREIGDRSVMNLLFTHLTHDNRHLGMIEALRGVLGLRGTATR